MDAVKTPAVGGTGGGIAGYFRFAERRTDLVTETRAGLTTFMVMAYILFVNGNIIAKPLGLDPAAVAAGTALVAGLMTIAMGVVGNYPFAIAAGLGINAIVAFTLTAKNLDAAGAMGVIVLEGIAITILVAVGAREAIMNAVPLALKRSIGVGIGLFILFIGLISINLAVVNFLPIPLLDGGHMVFLIYEKVRGKPAPEKLQEYCMWGGVILILLLMAFVTFLDVRKLFF